MAASVQIWCVTASSGSGDSSIEQSWWLSPVPPPGPLRLVVRCTDIGIEETVVELDGTALSRAVDEVVTLWPWEPPRDRSPEPPPPPADLPADSWFARSS
jgi:hypothetical protein